MNPPFNDELHLAILKEAWNHLTSTGMCVNLAPCILLTSPRNHWSEDAIKKFNDIEVFQYIKEFKKIDDKDGYIVKLFNAAIQMHLGIGVYTKTKIKRCADNFAEEPLPASLMKKIMKKIEENSTDKIHGSGEYELAVSMIHGHPGCRDLIEIMNVTYESQLKSKGKNIIFFKTEQDRHDFYDFWMSALGRLILSIWKVDTHAYPKWVPYFWAKDIKDFYAFFNITEDEQKIIEETMEKYK